MTAEEPKAWTDLAARELKDPYPAISLAHPGRLST